MDPKVIEKFGGLIRLYGKSAFEKLHNSHICVIGLGGVGSWTCEALARSGVGSLTLVDLDDICVTNFNRQIHATDESVGRSKIEEMRARILSINPHCSVNLIHHFYTIKNADKILSTEYSYIVDAIDELEPKTHLLAECKKREINVISCGGSGGMVDATQYQFADLARVFGDSLLKKVRDGLRSDYGFPHGTAKKVKKFHIPCLFSPEEPRFPTPEGEITFTRKIMDHGKMNCNTGFGSSTHMTATAGLLAAQFCINSIIE